MDKNKVTRPVHLADFLVIATDFAHNIAQSVECLTGELMEIAVYHANRTTKINSVWEEFTNDLETIQEENDGA